MFGRDDESKKKKKPSPIPRNPISPSSSRTTQKRKPLLPKIPKSAPISKPLLQKSKSSTPSLKKLRNDKNPAKPSHPKPSKVAKEVPFQKQGQWQGARTDTGEPPLDNNLFSFGITSLDDSRNVTPLSKLGCGSCLVAMEENSIDETSTTPRVQASSSPEIQCGSMSSRTPTCCFGAGHFIAGVSDNRKCRPRGILIVGETLGFCKAKVSDAGSDDVLPLPGFSFQFANSASPSNFIDQVDLQKTSNDPFWQDSGSSFGNVSQSQTRISWREGLVSRTFDTDELDCCRWSSDEEVDVSCCVNDQFNSDIGCKLDKRIENDPTLISVSKSPEFVFKEHKIDVRSADSLGSQNVIRAPQSDSSSDRPIGFSWLMNAMNEDQQEEYRFELDSMTEMLQRTSLSPENQTLRWNPADVLPLPGFGFQFTNSASPSNFIDQVDLQKVSNDPFWQDSGSSFGNVSQSQTRISWREGLVSRTFDTDELDCCRWSSDEEVDVNWCVNDQFNSDISCKLDKRIENDPTLISVSKSPEIVFKEHKIDVRSAESISTEGGDLIASGDSDWMICYKSHLFRE